MKGLLRLAAAGLLAFSAVAAPSGHRRVPYVGAISADAATGRVLFEDGADSEAYPASVTKLMTLLLVLEDVKAGRHRLDDAVVATREVCYSEASWVGLKAGDVMTVRDLCQALMVESANDAAIALGVHVAGSFEAFVARMNARAAELGMARTKYFNPNGLPPNAKRRYPWKSFNVSTARDQVKLACALVKMPEALEFTSVKTCDLIKTPRGYRTAVTRRVNAPVRVADVAAGERIVKQMGNHNNVMRKDAITLVEDGRKVKLPRLTNPDGRETVDGLKTGYIEAGGSSVVLTGQRQGKRAIVVVLGSDNMTDAKGRVLRTSSVVRDEAARRLLQDALGALAW